MNSLLIVSTENVLGGSPRLNGRRLDVRHVIYGFTIESTTYKQDFEVSEEEIKHAILYCKDEVCELDKVPQACSGCSKKIEKDKLYDLEAWEDEDEELKDGWKDAQQLYEQYKTKLNLPDSY